MAAESAAAVVMVAVLSGPRCLAVVDWVLDWVLDWKELRALVLAVAAVDTPRVVALDSLPEPCKPTAFYNAARFGRPPKTQPPKTPSAKDTGLVSPPCTQSKDHETPVY